VQSIDSVQDIEGSEFEGIHIDRECELEETHMNCELEVSEHIQVQFGSHRHQSEHVHCVKEERRFPLQGELDARRLRNTKVVLISL